MSHNSTKNKRWYINPQERFFTILFFIKWNTTKKFDANIPQFNIWHVNSTGGACKYHKMEAICWQLRLKWVSKGWRVQQFSCSWHRDRIIWLFVASFLDAPLDWSVSRLKKTKSGTFSALKEITQFWCSTNFLRFLKICII